MLSQFRDLLLQQLLLLRVVLARDAADALESEGLVDGDGGRLGLLPVLRVVSCRAKKDGWVYLVGWEILLC